MPIVVIRLILLCANEKLRWLSVCIFSYVLEHFWNICIVCCVKFYKFFSLRGKFYSKLLHTIFVRKYLLESYYVILYHTISYCSRNFSVLFVSFENVKIFHFTGIKRSAENFSLLCIMLEIYALCFIIYFFFCKKIQFFLISCSILF